MNKGMLKFTKEMSSADDTLYGQLTFKFAY